jgi:molecular chaperone DnaK
MYANSTDGTEPPMQEAPSSDDSSKKDEKKIEDADFEVVED